MVQGEALVHDILMLDCQSNRHLDVANHFSEKKKKEKRRKKKIPHLTLNDRASVQKCHVSLYYISRAKVSHVTLPDAEG